MTGERDEAADDSSQYEVGPDESVAMAVVRAVAAASGRDPAGADALVDGLEPLATAIDPDALDQVFDSGVDGADSAATVEFRYCDHQVTVTGGETTTVAVR